MKKLILFALLIPSIALSQVPIRIIDRQYVSGDTIVAGGNDVKKALDSLRAVPPNSGIDAFARLRVDSLVANNAVNVKAFGAKGDGVTNDRKAIQTLLNSLVPTGGKVHIPAGTYIINEDSLPSELPRFSRNGLAIPSNVELYGDGIGRTILKLGDHTATYSDTNSMVFICNYHPSTGSPGDSNFVIRDMTIDLNAENQTEIKTHPTSSQAGVYFWGATRVLLENLYVKGVWGTTSGPPGESADIAMSVSSHVVVRGCYGDGTYHASTGIGANSSFDVTFQNCNSFGHHIGAGGYSIWQCNQVRFVDCIAWSNFNYSGFNCEASDNVDYINCYSGGKPRIISGFVASPYLVGDSVGNTHGWVINVPGSGKIRLTNCISEYNAINGINCTNATSLQVIGGSYRKNGGYGILVSDTTARTELIGVELDSNRVGHNAAIGKNLYIDNAGLVNYGSSYVDSLKIESGTQANLTFSGLNQKPYWTIGYKPTSNKRLDFMDSTGLGYISLYPPNFIQLYGNPIVLWGQGGGAAILKSKGIVNGSGSAITDSYISTANVPDTYFRVGGLYADSITGYGLFADSHKLNFLTTTDKDIVFNRNNSPVLTLGSGTATFTGSVIASSFSSTGSRVYNVRDFGATGDGITNDSAAIAQARVAARAVRGTVFFPAGKYKYPMPLVADTSEMHIEGQGRSSELYYTGASDAIQVMKGDAQQDNIEIKNLTITGTSSMRYGINRRNALFGNVENVHIRGGGKAGIREAVGMATSFTNIYISGEWGTFKCGIILDTMNTTGNYTTTMNLSNVNIDHTDSVALVMGYSTRSCVFTDFIVEANTGKGVTAETGCLWNTFNNTWFETNTDADLTLKAGANYNMFRNPRSPGRIVVDGASNTFQGGGLDTVVVSAPATFKDLELLTNYLVTISGTDETTWQDVVDASGNVYGSRVKIPGSMHMLPTTKPATPTTGVRFYIISGGANPDTIRAIDHLGNIKQIMP